MPERITIKVPREEKELLEQQKEELSTVKSWHDLLIAGIEAKRKQERSFKTPPEMLGLPPADPISQLLKAISSSDGFDEFKEKIEEIREEETSEG